MKEVVTGYILTGFGLHQFLIIDNDGYQAVYVNGEFMDNVTSAEFAVEHQQFYQTLDDFKYDRINNFSDFVDMR